MGRSVDSARLFAIASLVLGVSGALCLGLLTGFPAILCAKRARALLPPHDLRGAKLAKAGQFLGFLSIATTVLVLGIAPLLSQPYFYSISDEGRLNENLRRANQIALALNMMALDLESTGDKRYGFPADVGIQSVSELKNRIVQGEYLTDEDCRRLEFENFDFGNVSAGDPPEVLLLISKIPRGKENLRVVAPRNEKPFIASEEELKAFVSPDREPAWLPPD